MTGVAFVTAIENAGSDVVTLPSLTRMTMLSYVPVLTVVGVPLSLPVAPSNSAQAGVLTPENVSVSRSSSAASGVNVYAAPAATVVAGVPEIVGARFGCGTVIVNAG